MTALPLIPTEVTLRAVSSTVTAKSSVAGFGSLSSTSPYVNVNTSSFTFASVSVGTNAIDLVAGLIGQRAVREIRVYGGIVFHDAAAIQLQTVLVDVCTVNVIVPRLDRVLEDQRRGGRSAFIVGLAGDAQEAQRQVDLRRARDRPRLR